MARVHLFSSSPHNEKRRRISNTTAATTSSNNTTTTTLSTTDDSNKKSNHTNINELSRLTQFNQPPPPTLSDDTHTLDITAVPSPSSVHTTSAVHSPALTNVTATNNNNNNDNQNTTIKEPSPGLNYNNLRSSAVLTAALLQNATNDIDLVGAFAAALSGKPESLQLLWDKVRRNSNGGGDTGQRQDDSKEKERQQQQQPESSNTDIMEQEAAATALQLLGLASSSSEKRPSIDAGKVKASSNQTNTISSDTTGTTEEDANATAAAAAAVLRQALAHHQQQPQQQQQQQQHTDNGTRNDHSTLNASMLMANYPNLASPGGSVDGLELQEDIMQDYKRGSWTREEDELLLMGIKKHGYGRWKEIANTIPGRKGKQLKQRWDNTLASKYVDRELLQSKLRHDEQLAKLQHHLDGLTSTTLPTTSTPPPPPPVSSTSQQSDTSQLNNNKSNILSMPKVEQADWTEIAHKITEKVREGDQEAIEALLSQALLGTGHSLEASSTSSPTTTTTGSTTQLPPSSSIKQEGHDNTSTNTTTATTDTSNHHTPTESQISTRSSSMPTTSTTSTVEAMDYNRPPTTSVPTTEPSSSVPVDTSNNMNTTSTSSTQAQNVLNYADAAALSLYQQLSQQQTNVGESNGSNNPLATIQALASNQYFLSNLFANVENGGDGTGAALAAAAAAAAAAMAHATATANGSNVTAADASSLLAATMRSHLNAGNQGSAGTNNNNNISPGDSTNNNKKKNNNETNMITTGTTTSTTNTPRGSTSPSSKHTTINHKRRRSDPALANTQSEAMSIYASSAPITTMVNNLPQTVYPCLFPNCGKAFARLYNLKSHSRTHTDDRPFCCQLCNTAFSRNHDLKRHLKTHVGEKPYKCGGCQKTFSRLDALKRHKSNARNQAVCLDS